MSRGSTIRQFDPPGKPEPVKTYPASLAELGRNAFALQVGHLYYTDHGPGWTPHVLQAHRWEDRAVPDGIVAYWKKVHYQDKDGKNGIKLSTSLFGQNVLNVEVVDVADKLVPVSETWD